MVLVDLSVELAVFLTIAAIMLGSAILVFAMKEIMHSIVFLAIVFISVASLFVLLNAEFLAVIQILIQVGAVVVLFLFAVLLTRRKILVRKERA